jgi:hypothetical protein
MARGSGYLLFLCGLAAALSAQTTQGVIAGRVLDRRTNLPVAGVTVTCTGATPVDPATSDAGGFYTLPLVSPGSYLLTADKKDGYQPHSIYVELPVAARINADFALRPLADVWNAESMRFSYTRNNRIVNFYVTDVERVQPSEVDLLGPETSSLHTGQSHVIDRRMLDALPLAGRDAYAMLAFLPGVTAQNASSRGLGISVNGQRPSSSNFLLDGLESNNYLITGNLLPVAPEALQEYRVSTSNFSAEYGRTSGFLANAVTRTAGSEWHGRFYYYTGNDALNANEFQNKRFAIDRLPWKEARPGFVITGPLLRQRLFTSVAYEHLRFRSGNEPGVVLLPTRGFVETAALAPIARTLLDPSALPDGPGLSAGVRVTPVDALNRHVALPRFDWSGGRHRVTFRGALVRARQPEFIRSPYPGYSSPLQQDTAAPALIWTATPYAAVTSETHLGWTFDDLRFNRARPEVPILSSADGIALPGSPALFSYRNRNRSWEAAENLILVSGAHTWKFGGGLLARTLDGYLTAGREPFVFFTGIDAFASDEPFAIQLGFDRESFFESPRAAAFDRRYRQTGFFLFAQDSVKVNRRLFVNYGVRYDFFGSPQNTGAVKDALITLGPGETILERLASPSTKLQPAGGRDQPLYESDRNDWSARAGLSYNLRGAGRTLVRGAAGIYYDRPFDNLWQTLRNNSLLFGLAFPAGSRLDYASPVSALLNRIPFLPSTGFPLLTLFQPGLRTPYTMAWSFGLQHQAGTATTLEVSTLGSEGRKGITTDIVNREFSLPATTGNNGRLNAGFGDLYYRANQGISDYRALIIAARHRSRRALLQASYTWSRTRDNQSEPLAGDFFDFSSSLGPADAEPTGLATFSRQFDSRADWGNSDFDQRHNFVFVSTWDLPGVFRGWTVSQTAALRSGFPFTVLAPDARLIPRGGEPVRNNRANLLSPGQALQNVPAGGGRLLLNESAFAAPAPGSPGDTRRNQWHGPGIVSFDLSVSRSFSIRENVRLKLRADAFNVLNHANLNNPEITLLGSSGFGLASFGRVSRGPGLFSLLPRGRVLTLAPFNEAARQVQILLSLDF